jgi:hypothetical protein
MNATDNARGAKVPDWGLSWGGWPASGGHGHAWQGLQGVEVPKDRARAAGQLRGMRRRGRLPGDGR